MKARGQGSVCGGGGGGVGKGAGQSGEDKRNKRASSIDTDNGQFGGETLKTDMGASREKP